MKFMKLGSKPDLFQTEGDNIRYVATELATDMVIGVGDVKFYVHKFPLLSKSSRLQKLVASSTYDTNEEINIDEIPGGPATFEICAKFCYGMAVTLNAYNVLAARCAAEYLEMHETIEKGNLVRKIDIFLTSTIFRTWKDSIIFLRTTKYFPTWSEELKVVTHCIDSIATHASTDPSRVDWSYTYNRKNGARKQQIIPNDWWAEELCDLPIDLYKTVITTIKGKGRLSGDIIGEALRTYAVRRLPGFGKVNVQGGDHLKYRYVVDTIIYLLPEEKGSVPCSFLMKLLLASVVLECGEMGRRELMHRIAGQLEEATVADFLTRLSTGETKAYSIDVVYGLVELFVMRECSGRDGHELYLGFDPDSSKMKVARLVDSYLAYAARDPSLALAKFVGLAEMVSRFPRSSHDEIYRAVDMYLKEHPGLMKSEKKRICRLIDCRRLSADACAHAVENERLPSRLVVKVLFFEQSRATGTTNSDEDWESNQTSEELKDCVRNGRRNDGKAGTPRKVKKMLSRLWSNSSSDVSENAGSVKEADMGNLGRK